MLIKMGSLIINLDNVLRINLALIESGWAVKFFFFEGEEGEVFLPYESAEEAGKAIEKIVDDYRRQRLVCTLD